MRRTLFLMSVLVASLASAPLAAAQPPADSAVTVRAGFGPEQFPIAGVSADVTPCAGGAAVPVTTGKDGSATAPVAAGCYRVQVATPSGCTLDGDATQQVTAIAGITPIASFRFRCA
ncbi:hypothetical protein [Nocardia jejuensis]|uniref:hypothetical protein n=1 Tax=Nocardia jejuensis TaxID=328049 RepID=UPI0012FA5595|nr:hypothetical protein [Nocardia jejuensis]